MWYDVVKGVEKNLIVVFTHKGDEARAAFLDTWDQLEDKDSVGVSLRWVVVAGDDDKMKVQLQAMPAPRLLAVGQAHHESPIIKLLELPVNCDMFDGDCMASPFPTLFAANETAVMEALKENVGLVHSDLQKLARRFFCPEYVHPKEAAAIVACPREGMGVCRFRRPKYQPRPSYQQQPASTQHQDKRLKTSHVAGRIDPHPDPNLAKYSTETNHLSKFLSLLNLNEPVRESPLTNAAYAKSTWAKHCTSVNSYNDYVAENRIPYRWPLELDNLIGYIEWAVYERNLSASSVKSYVSSLHTTHNLINIKTDIFENPIIKLMLKGAENTCKNLLKPTRKIVTIPILKLIGHEIAGFEWSSYSKQVYWSACCTSFFGSTRMGELLAENESKFDPTTTLTWNDVEFFWG